MRSTAEGCLGRISDPGKPRLEIPESAGSKVERRLEQRPELGPEQTDCDHGNGEPVAQHRGEQDQQRTPKEEHDGRVQEHEGGERNRFRGNAEA